MSDIPRPLRRSDAQADLTDPTEPTSPSEAARRVEEPEAPRAERAPRAPSAPPRARANAMESRLAELFSAPALAFSLAGDMHCAEIINNGGPEMARAWAKLAQENPAVRRVLNTLLEGSAWGGVVLSTLSVALPIAAHHGVKLPGPWSGGSDHRQDPPAGAPNWGTPRPSAPSGGGFFSGWTSETPPAASAQAPAAPVAPVAPVGPTDDVRHDPAAPPVYFHGAPPGVVTVASGPANHSGAR